MSEAQRQADLVHVVELMEEQDNNELRLSEEQAAEVRRRLANPNTKTIAAEEVFRRFRSGTIHGARDRSREREGN